MRSLTTTLIAGLLVFSFLTTYADLLTMVSTGPVVHQTDDTDPPLPPPPPPPK